MHLILRCLNALIVLVRCQLSQTVHAKAIDANMQLSGRKPGQFTSNYDSGVVIYERKLFIRLATELYALDLP